MHLAKCAHLVEVLLVILCFSRSITAMAWILICFWCFFLNLHSVKIACSHLSNGGRETIFLLGQTVYCQGLLLLVLGRVQPLSESLVNHHLGHLFDTFFFVQSFVANPRYVQISNSMP